MAKRRPIHTITTVAHTKAAAAKWRTARTSKKKKRKAAVPKNPN
ncbi:MAG: hypothetical protein WB660_24530 [Candidatus Sulfotelmatobacter sp.]